jgi:hypothetical protein
MLLDPMIDSVMLGPQRQQVRPLAALGPGDRERLVMR